MYVCPSLKTFSHDTFKVASQLRKVRLSKWNKISKMRVENVSKIFRENHLVHFIGSFAQPHFSQLGRRLKSIVWGKV
jgi:hypothetical protein